MMKDKAARDKFIGHYMQGEADFLELAGLNHNLAVSYDGHQLHIDTGTLTAQGHTFSAASKESLHWAVMLKVLEDDPRAAPFGSEFSTLRVLDRKMQSYEGFNEKYPGYGWFLPWYSAVNDTMAPTWDWGNRVPSLDNGQLFWAAYSVLFRLKESYPNAPYNLIPRI